MPPHQRTRAAQIRLRLSQEAARILLDSGGRNYLLAKRKAAQHLGLPETTRHLPSNREVEQALEEHQRLFHADTQPELLQRLRSGAVDAMQFLERFSPHLVGPVLTGTADIHTEINLHLCADTYEEPGLFLMQYGIPFESKERRLRLHTGEHAHQPEYRFEAGDTTIALTVFIEPGAHFPPLSPVDGRPMRRASLAEVEALLKEPE